MWKKRFIELLIPHDDVCLLKFSHTHTCTHTRTHARAHVPTNAHTGIHIHTDTHTTCSHVTISDCLALVLLLDDTRIQIPARLTMNNDEAQWHLDVISYVGGQGTVRLSLTDWWKA